MDPMGKGLLHQQFQDNILLMIFDFQAVILNFV